MKKSYLEARATRPCMGTLLCEGRGRIVALVSRCVVLLGSRRPGRGPSASLPARPSAVVPWAGQDSCSPALSLRMYSSYLENRARLLRASSEAGSCYTSVRKMLGPRRDLLKVPTFKIKLGHCISFSSFSRSMKSGMS